MIVTRNQFAEIVGCTPRMVTKWLREGMPADAGGTKGKARQITTASAINWLMRRSAGHVAPSELQTARAKLTSAKARLAETQAAIAQGSVIPTESAQVAFNEFAVRIVRILESWPGRIANTCAHQEAGVIRQRAKNEVHAIRTAAIANTADELAALGKQSPEKGKPTTKKPRRPRHDSQ